MPSLYEGLANAALEGCASGLPAILSHAANVDGIVAEARPAGRCRRCATGRSCARCRPRWRRPPSGWRRWGAPAAPTSPRASRPHKERARSDGRRLRRAAGVVERRVPGSGARVTGRRPTATALRRLRAARSPSWTWSARYSTCSSSGPGSAAARSRTRCRAPGSRCCWSNAAAGRRATRPTGAGAPSCSTAAIRVKPRSACASPAPRAEVDTFPNEVVGGNSIFFGGAALRLRATDFARWPISYADLEPHYAAGGSAAGGARPRRRRPVRAAAFRRLPVPARAADRARPAHRRSGARAGPAPVPHPGRDQPRRRARAPSCINCFTCDGFPVPHRRQERRHADRAREGGSRTTWRSSRACWPPASSSATDASWRSRPSSIADGGRRLTLRRAPTCCRAAPSARRR